MDPYTLRPPGVDDAEALARAHLAVWRATYGRLLPDGVAKTDTMLGAPIDEVRLVR